jgi:TctA family transporter
LNEEKPVGNYRVNFNASNLASGVYFYRITAGSFNMTRKLIVLK